MKLLLVFLAALHAVSVVVGATGAEDARRKIDTLRAEIARHDELYHRRASPEISDADYDALKRKLVELERAFPEAARAATPRAEISDDRSGLFATRRHHAPMLSLEKTYTEAELRAFVARVEKAARAAEGAAPRWVVEPKFDGLALSAVFEKGVLVAAVTRGNGLEGDDVTAHVRRIEGFPLGLAATEGAPLPDWVEVRGEVYVPFAEFARVNQERELSGEPAFATPRNLAAGTLRQTDPQEVVRRGLRVVFFGVGACEPTTALPSTHTELRSRLATWGLPTVPQVWTAQGAAELVRAVEALRRERDAFPFPTDGAVVKIDARALQTQLGASEAAPRWALAFKFAAERAETQLRAITVQVGRTGVLTPVAELAPVSLGGASVARATLHNAEEIARRDVRVGDFVFVEKAGEIIPAIVGVNRARRPEGTQPFAFPVDCPECAQPVVRRENEIAVRCGNEACAGQLRRRLEHFAGKDALAIDGLGPAVVQALVEGGHVRAVEDLYRLQREDLLRLPRVSARTAERLLAAIEQSRRAELWRVIHGFGVPQVGVSAAKELARTHGSLAALAAADERFRVSAQRLIEAGVQPVVVPVTERRLAGKTFVLTGTLPTLSRAEATALIERAGGKVSSRVSRAIDFLVVGDEPGAKLAQAHAAGVAVIGEAELRRMVGAP